MNFSYKVIKIIYLYVLVKGKLYTLKITGGMGKVKEGR
jgi:hypothetical protein